MRVLDEHFQPPMKTYTFEDCLDPEKMKLIAAQQRKEWNKQCMPRKN